MTGYAIKAVLFDFDGTLTEPGALDFKSFKDTIGCPADLPVLEYIDTMDDPAQQRRILDRLDRFETDGARHSRPNAGAGELVAWVKSRALPVGIITRNSRRSVLRALENFDDLGPGDFELLITRDDPFAVKPRGDGIVWAARQWRIEPREILTVGDYLFDPQAGQAAGAITVLLDPGDHPRLADVACHFRVRRLNEVVRILEAGLPLPAGKLPNHLLNRYLALFPFEDPSILIGPGVGQDVAAVDVDGAQVLILKTDPITFATDAIGQYAVSVAANDIATSGAMPRWLLTTLLLPLGTTPSQIEAIMQELHHAAHQQGIALCGGHTEISDAVQRPVVVAAMAGTVRRKALVEKKNMSRHDVVLLTKQVALEGTAILAREFEAPLRTKGFSGRQLAEGRQLLDRISVVPEATLAARHGWVTAMHDVTEGGVATALAELSAAGGHRLRVDMEKIPVRDLTARMCAAMGLDPLGLIGSGSLLMCCRPEHSDVLKKQLQARGIGVAAIGRVLEPGEGIDAFDHGRPVPWPEFKVDEIVRLFDGAA